MSDITYTTSLLASKKLSAPIADAIPYNHEMHGDTRPDPYFWMRLTDAQKLATNPDEATKKVVTYLENENSYLNSMMEELKPLQDTLFEEIKGRIKQNDESVPYKYNGYWYITRFEEGKEYAIRSRKKENLDNKEEILLNENELATPYKYYATSGRNISPNNVIYAYGEDTLSRRQYNVKFKNLETGALLDDAIPNTEGSVVWANDNKTIFYTKKDASLRSFKIFKHKLGTPVSEDKEVYHEKDETFNAFIFKTKSNKYIVIGSYATVSQDYRYIDADKPDEAFKIFQTRERDLEYSIDHYENNWYITTNKDGAKNFKIMSCPVGNTSKDNWVDFIAHDPLILRQGVELFDKYMVVSERVKGITKLNVIPWADKSKSHYIDFKEDAYFTYVSVNPDFKTNELRVEFTSLTTPNTTYDYNMDTKQLVVKKKQEVIGEFDQSLYTSERIYAKASDGTEVPISIVYKKGFKKDGTRPLLLYGYGSYGASMEPTFSSVRLSLLDRGFAYAIAHIRGGQEMGRSWYEDGKLLKKKNTFTDFIACGEHLITQKYTSASKQFAMGGSAGGLLIGAVVNMKPELWKGVICAVPFVDVVSTMLDESIPLTTGEFDEWGNPKVKEYYDYMKSYSPYDNIEKKDYPAMMITTGFHDSQVQYWEPAKYLARLRAMKTDSNPLVMYCNMAVGHGGASGRFERYKETAMEYAFLLDLAGLSYK
jgi:oligopeptidase B